MNDKVVIIAIVAVAMLEGIALFKGIDGAFFGPAVAAISGLAGYKIKESRDKKIGGDT